MLFVNGRPLAVIELKNPADENATISTAFKQLQTYKAEIPSLFAFNAALIASDGLEARIGTLTAGWEWFKRWRTVAGEALADPSLTQLHLSSSPTPSSEPLAGAFRSPRSSIRSIVWLAAAALSSAAAAAAVLSSFSMMTSA